jgi:hypothetical protein
VNDVYDEVIAKFEEMDRNFIAERLIELENKKKILIENRGAKADCREW